MLCNSYFVKLLALVFPHVFNHRFFCCSSMACRLWTTEMDLSITRLFVSKKSKHTLITPHGIGYSVLVEFDPFFVTVKQNCSCWYLSLVSTSCLHQMSSLHLELFHNKNYQWFTDKIALSSKYALSATFKLKWHF